jgi:hypothetical protein
VTGRGRQVGAPGLRWLPDAAARAALVGPSATLGVECQEKAARQVVRESAGYPYFSQEYGLELWNHAERTPITSTEGDAFTH